MFLPLLLAHMRWLFVGLGGWLWAQASSPVSLPEIEQQLAKIGPIILNHEDMALKDSLNKEFLALWLKAFSVPEAFSYPFDSVVTVSDLCPPDSAFRILTWQIVDFEERDHYYYGIVVRRWRKDKKSPWQVRAYVLKEIPEVLQEDDIEQRTLDHTQWVGALYYHPRYSKHGVLRYEGWVKVPRGRKIVKEKLVYYVLLGWNGYDKRRNFKVIETVFFDPRQPEKVFFGAPVIYSGPVPKMRVILPYSETTPLSLNKGWFVPKQGSRRQIEAIVFDHVSTAGRRSQKTLWEDPRPFFGADGTYDALVFLKKGLWEGRRGILVYRRNVIPYAPEIEHYDPKVIQRQREEAMRKLRQYGFSR
jgi:hypothetical protein